MFAITPKTREIEDDAGVRHVISWSLNAKEQRNEQLRRRIQAEVIGSNPFGGALSWRKLGLFAVFFAAIVIGQIAVATLGLTGWLRMVAPLGAYLVAFAALAFLNRNDTRRTYQRGAAISVEEGVCGVCWYELRGTPVGENGLIVCPECCASWDATKIRKGAAEYSGSAESPEARTALARPLFFDLPKPISDDAGRRFALVKSRDLRRRAKHANIAERARLREAARALWLGGLLRRLVFLALFGVWMYAMMYSVLFGAPPGLTMPSLLRLGSTVISLFFACMVGAAALFGDRVSARRGRRILLERFMCPACGESIHGVPANVEGLAVCPSCTAAWKSGAEAGA